MGREDFDSRVTGARNKVLRRTLTDGTLKVQLKIKAHGDDVPWPFNAQVATLSREEQYLDRLYGLTQEVVAAYDAMRSVELYLARFLFARQGVSASAYRRMRRPSVLI